MLTNIHMVVEIRYQGVWKNYDHYRISPYSGAYERVPLYDKRDKVVFTVLGAPTGLDIDSVQGASGIPPDACDQYMEMVYQHRKTGHSHCAVRLSDLKKLPHSALDEITKRLQDRAQEHWGHPVDVENAHIRIVYFFTN